MPYIPWSPYLDQKQQQGIKDSVKKKEATIKGMRTIKQVVLVGTVTDGNDLPTRSTTDISEKW